MSLKIQKNADGSFRSTWWGRLSVKGKKRETNLGISIKGTIPVDRNGNVRLTAKGDEAFEKSRKEAQKAFEAWRKEVQKDPAELQAKAFKARTGEGLEGLPLSKLFDYWRNNVIRAKKTSETWCGVVEKWFSQFANFCQAVATKGRRCETANDVTLEIANKWFEHIKSAYAWETVSKMKHLVSGTFANLQANGLARKNPFANIQLRGGGTGENRKVSRKALSIEELDRLLEVARDTDIYPLVVTAASSGMRIGDVCNLKWADVDMRHGLISCVTAKAGGRVTIPILGRLRDVLEDASPISADVKVKAPSPYVFPTAQANYSRNPDGIFRAVKPLFARAVFGDTQEPAEVAENGETTRELADVINGAGYTEKKRGRLLEVYTRTKAGARQIEIAAALKIARSQVSMDLREIEKLTGRTLRPMAAQSAARKTRLDLIEKTRQERGIGKRAASVYGWHSLRHTFVILALQAGVPVEDVRRIVGHGEAETTLENYYNPETKHAAENLRMRMQGSILDGKGKGKKRIVANVPATAKPSVDELIAGLSDEQKKELARKLLGL